MHNVWIPSIRTCYNQKPKRRTKEKNNFFFFFSFQFSFLLVASRFLLFSIFHPFALLHRRSSAMLTLVSKNIPLYNTTGSWLTSELILLCIYPSFSLWLLLFLYYFFSCIISPERPVSDISFDSLFQFAQIIIINSIVAAAVLHWSTHIHHILILLYSAH